VTQLSRNNGVPPRGGLTNYGRYRHRLLAPQELYDGDRGRQGEQVRECKGMVKALHKAG